MNYQKVYPSAPELDDPSSSRPIQQPPIAYQKPMNNFVQNSGPAGYVPQSMGPSFAKSQQQEQMFHIQPFPGPGQQQPPHYAQPNTFNHVNAHHQQPNYKPPAQPPFYHQSQQYAPNFGAPPPYSNFGPQPTNTVLIDKAAFDSGARFNQGASPSIPPPPPGCLPNAAQMAQASGQQVILGKKKSGFWFQKGAGSTFW